jgi:hypothetical protein
MWHATATTYHRTLSPVLGRATDLGALPVIDPADLVRTAWSVGLEGR